MPIKFINIFILPILLLMVLSSSFIYAGWNESSEDCSNMATDANDADKCVELNIPLLDPSNPETKINSIMHEAGTSQGGMTIMSIMVKYMYKITLYFAGTILVGYMVWGGIQLMLSRGTASSFTAKEKIIMSIQGIIILLFAGYFLYIINPTFFSFGQ